MTLIIFWPFLFLRGWNISQVHWLSLNGRSIQARGVLCCLAYMSQCHSLPFTLHPPPLSLHTMVNLILGLLIVGAFSQAFFQFTSIPGIPVRLKKVSSKREEILGMRLLIRDWLTSPHHHHHHHLFTSNPLFSFLFLMGCSFPVKWIITVGIILVTWHYLDEVNNWNLCLKGFYLVERNGSAGRAMEGGGWAQFECKRTHTFICTCACQTGHCVRLGTPVMLTDSDSPRPDQQALAHCTVWILLCCNRVQLWGQCHSLCYHPC